MKVKPKALGLLTCLFLGSNFLTGAASTAMAEDLKLEAHLIWGTDLEKSPNPEHKPVSPGIRAKLCKLPIKWKNYFEVKRKEFKVAEGETETVKLSKECEIKVKNVDGKSIELEVIGKGVTVGKIVQCLEKGKCLVTGGDAENLTSWFVFLRQAEKHDKRKQDDKAP